MTTEADAATKTTEGDPAPQITDDPKPLETSLGDEPLLGSAQRAVDAENEQPVPTIESLTADLETIRKELTDSKQAASTAEGRVKAAGQGDNRLDALTRDMETLHASNEILQRQVIEGFKNHETPEDREAAINQVAVDGQAKMGETAFNNRFRVKQDKYRELIENTPEAERAPFVEQWSKVLTAQQRLPLEQRDLSLFDDLYVELVDNRADARVSAAEAQTKETAEKAQTDRAGLAERHGVMDNDPGTTTGGGDSDEAFLDRMGSDENAASLQDAIRLREIYSKRGINI